MSSKVIVLGTMHATIGECNAKSLLQIIHEISPDTIYFEASKLKYPQMLMAVDDFNTPEIVALREIEKKSKIEIKPIDLDNDPFDGRLELMMEGFEKKISDYKFASLIQKNESFRLGYKFLNSPDNDQIFKDRAVMEKHYVQNSKNKFLIETYNKWLEWNNLRENNWISAIHEHILKKPVDNSVLIVGSAHRIRLKEKVSKLKFLDQSIPDWEFNYLG